MPPRLDMSLAAWDDHEMPRLLLVVSAIAGVATAQTSTPHRTVWDGVYTEAQASRGTTAYGQSCAGCHALSAAGKAPLVGDAFWKSFSQKSVGELLDFVSTYMPNGSPGSLSADAYQDIVALMLKSNGFPAGAAELRRNTVAEVEIIPKDGNTELPAGALARVIGCLARSGSDWVVTTATAPERAEHAAPAGDDARRALGSHTIALKFVLTRLDSMAGSRVLVKGLLIGNNGVDGINVTEVSRIAAKCP